ncbi:MAG: IS66 family insertion sequence element accessory protein TnpB [Proteobacteria bacterium]|nr:IS66 family insertion sequence element accessory protein TnpB [Pseudomonadota bacterium]
MAEPLDIRAGTDTVLARVVSVFGQARAHHAYLFANRRANRLKLRMRSTNHVLARLSTSVLSVA